MKIPKRVKIGGINYIISDKHDLDNWGQVCYADQIIHLKSSLSPQQKEMTFLHEVLHAIISDRALDDRINEEMVENLGAGLYAFFRTTNMFLKNRKEIQMKKTSKWLSRKLLLTVAGIIVSVLVALGKISQEQTNDTINLIVGTASLVATLLGYQISQAIVDKEEAKSESSIK